jgi:hypothetical protein
VSRLRLRLNPLHADGAGGLGFLGDSATAFAPVLVAQSTFFATFLGNRIWHQGARLSDFKVDMAALVALLLLLVLFPLTFFAGQLWEARLRGSRRYGRLATRYTSAFEAKWIESDGRQGEPLLGTSDIQSLSDLANSYDVVRTMRLVPFGKSVVLRLAVIVALPLLALTLTMVPLEQLVPALINAFV